MRCVLGGRDYERMLDLAVMIVKSHRPASLWPEVMGELAAVLHSTAGLFADGRVDRARIRAEAKAWTPELGGLPLSDLLREYVLQHPLGRHYVTTPDRSALIVDDLLPEREWRRTDVYHSARELAGFTRHIAVALPAPLGSIRALLFGRPGRNFSDRDRSFLQRVQPLLSGADAQIRELGRWRRSVDSGRAGEVVADVRLTPRELATLGLLAQSLTARAIAHRLSISTNTVHKHLSAIYRKLGTTDRLATVLRAQKLGLLPGQPSQESATVSPEPVQTSWPSQP